MHFSTLPKKNRKKSKHEILLLVLLLLSFSNANWAQNESRFWHFGYNAALDFSTSPPTSIAGCAMVTNEGCASISDGTGSLLFYTNGINVYNSTNAVMANGTGLFGSGSTTQSSIIVKQPGSASLYYIFTLVDAGGPNGLCYSKVDMTLAAGLGSVTVKNVSVYTPSCEKLTAIKHCNGTDIWILSHEDITNNFRAYLLTSAGLNSSPIISTLGYAPSTSGESLGQMKVSPTGNKIGVAIYNTSIVTPAPFEIFDFDPATGVLSNALNLGASANNYGCEFSPDGTKFYGSVYSGQKIYQWDLCAGSPTAVINSKFTYSTSFGIIGSLQLASDGKIYVARSTATLSIINNPNSAGAGANYTDNGLILTSGSAALGLPNFVNTVIRTSNASFTSSIQCSTASFSSAVAVGQTSSTCGTITNTISSITWNFGDPNSGSANSASGSNVNHQFSTNGSYTVKLKVFYPCYADSSTQVITIQNSLPLLNVTGQLSICKGDKRNYSSTGAATYTWSSGATGSLVSLSPTATTVYSVTATGSNSCSGSKQFTITVNKCTDIETNSQNFELSIAPNPFDSELFVHCENPGIVELRDASGLLVFEYPLVPGSNRINTSTIPPGIYSLKLRGSNFPIKKMIKVP